MRYDSLVDEVKARLKKRGWRERRGNDEDYGNHDRDHCPELDFYKSFTVKVGSVVVEGTGYVCPASICERITNVARNMHGRNFSLHLSFRLGWLANHGSVGHPHDSSGFLCHAVPISKRGMETLQETETVATWIAHVVDDAFHVLEPTGLAHPDWEYCSSCNQIYLRSYAHRCVRLRADPSFERFGHTVLVGCGVTGSWTLPVLARWSRLVTVFDPDVVDNATVSGFWPHARGQARMSKVAAAVEERYRDRVIGIRRRFTKYTQVPSPSLLVLACDSARARLQAVRNPYLPENVTVIDLRVTQDQLVSWVFLRGSLLSRTWRESLKGYPVGVFRCGDHDRVPVAAGTLAAAFVTSLFSTDAPQLEQGIWTIPLASPWGDVVLAEDEPELETRREAPDDRTPAREVLVSPEPPTRN